MNKKITNSLIIVFFLGLVGILSYLFLFKEKPIEVENITLNKNSLTLILGTSEKLKVTILPENATDKSVIWQSSDDNIAIVTNDGEVYANNVGNAIISVKSKNGTIIKNCDVTVETKKVERIELDKTNLELYIGDSDVITPTIYPQELMNDEVSWQSSNPDVASVIDGVIEAISVGETTITITSSDGLKSASCTVKVLTIPVSNVSLSANNLVLVKGASAELSATVTPSNAIDPSITWISSNPNVVSVENGKVLAKSTGTATITVTTTDGNKKDNCSIKVVDIKTHNQQNEAITAYLKNPGNLISIYNKCKNSNCTIANQYKTSLSGSINIYEYESSTNTKKLIKTTSSGINNYLVPGKTYYLESTKNTNNVEVVKITGNVRTLNILANCRDLGGWSTEEGTKVKYGAIYRSAGSSGLSESLIKVFNIGRIVDLRGVGDIGGQTDASKKIRKVISISSYSINGLTRQAVTEVMKSVVADKNVLFNCGLGQDRAGTLAYMIEGILGVTLENRKRDYELTYFTIVRKTRNDGSFVGLINKVNEYGKTRYDQERFINWYLSGSSNKNSDLQLINNFRKKMINGTPKEYKLSGGKLVLS